MSPRPPVPAADLEHTVRHVGSHWNDLRRARIFVTGGTGFFGAWLIESLLLANSRLNLGSHVTLLSRDPAGFARRCPHVAADPSVTVIAGDVRTFEVPRVSFSHVIHAATESSTQLHPGDDLLMFDTIVIGTRRVLELAADVQAKAVLLVSSGAVYGPQRVTVSHVTEDAAGAPDLGDPASAYAEGKRAAELLGAIIGKRRGLAVKVARCFAFVGPGLPLDAHFAIGNLMSDALAGRRLTLRSDGTPRRSYLYGADLAVWLWTILLRGEPGRAYNVGAEEDLTLSELAATIGRIVGDDRPVALGSVPDSSRAPARYVPSTARARRELGLGVHIELDDAIRRTLAWHRLSRS